MLGWAVTIGYVRLGCHNRLGWLGPVTSFPKLLVLGEETGEGGGCRRRVKGRKKRMIVSCVNVWSRGRMEGD